MWSKLTRKEWVIISCRVLLRKRGCPGYRAMVYSTSWNRFVCNGPEVSATIFLSHVSGTFGWRHVFGPLSTLLSYVHSLILMYTKHILCTVVECITQLKC
jgi:hypothetical protein